MVVQTRRVEDVDIRREKQQGNVLFLILIAVVLFAALSYAVTLSSRSGAESNKEALNVALSEVFNHFAQVRVAIQRITFSGTCTDKTIRFWHVSRERATNDNFYGDGSDTQCQIFHPDGGGVPYQTRPEELDTSTSAEYGIISNRIAEIGTTNNDVDSDGQGTAADLLIIANLPRAACVVANERLGVENPGGNPPQYTISTTSTFRSISNQNSTFPSSSTGGYVGGAGVTLGETSGGVAELRGKPAGCFHHAIDDYYTLYSVLIER